MMPGILPIAAAWALLVGLTLLSVEGLAGHSAAAVILIVAGVKAAIIGSEYMELRHAHIGLRLGFAAWLVAVVAGLCFLFT